MTLILLLREGGSEFTTAPPVEPPPPPSPGTPVVSAFIGELLEALEPVLTFRSAEFPEGGS